jgi:hypothetical protein
VDDIQRKVIRHAQKDLEAMPDASHDKKQPSLLDRFIAKRNEWAAEQPSLGAQLEAMWREGIKDVRQTLMESYFGKPEHMPEAGTPLNPTPQQVTDDLEPDKTASYNDRLNDLASRGGNDQERGPER